MAYVGQDIDANQVLGRLFVTASNFLDEYTVTMLVHFKIRLLLKVNNTPRSFAVIITSRKLGIPNVIFPYVVIWILAVVISNCFLWSLVNDHYTFWRLFAIIETLLRNCILDTNIIPAVIRFFIVN